MMSRLILHSFIICGFMSTLAFGGEAHGSSLTCQFLFAPERSALTVELQRQLEPTLLTFDATLHLQIRRVKLDMSRMGIQGFSKKTQDRLRDLTGRGVEGALTQKQISTYTADIEKILFEDPYFIHLEQIVPDFDPTTLAEYFIRSRHDDYILDITLLGLQRDFETRLNADTIGKIQKIEGSGLLLDLITKSDAYNYIYSYRSSDPFWATFRTIGEMRSFRIEALKAMRERHGAKLSEKIVAKFDSLINGPKRDIDLIRLITDSNAASDKQLIGRIRVLTGAFQNYSVADLKMIATQVFIESSYELVLAALYEDRDGKKGFLADLNLIRDILELSEAVDASEFRDYIKTLSDRRDRLRQIARP